MKNNKVILICGAGSSIDNIDSNLFKNFFTITLNYALLYTQEYTDINFIADYDINKWLEILQEKNLKSYGKIITKYNFKTGRPYELTNPEDKSILASACCTFRALDLALKYKPVVIGLIGVDFKGHYGKKLEGIVPIMDWYDSLSISHLAITRELIAIIKAKNQLKDTVKILNLSSQSRIILQDITPEEFLETYKEIS